MAGGAMLLDCQCPPENRPLCADRKTYLNPCELECVNVQRAVDGEPALQVTCYNVCPKCSGKRKLIVAVMPAAAPHKYTRENFECICPAVFHPVCANNKNYHNMCSVFCEYRRRVLSGKTGHPPSIICHDLCEKCSINMSPVIPRVDKCLCATVYSPICAGNKTFGNICLMHCENHQRESAIPPQPDLELTCHNSCDKCPKKFERNRSKEPSLEYYDEDYKSSGEGSLR